MTICNDHKHCPDDCSKCVKDIGYVRGYVYDTTYHAYEILQSHIKIADLCKGVK